MPRYKAPVGMKYVFQGPREVLIEGGGAGGTDLKVRVVGDMDLAEAMRIANRNVR